MKSIRVLCFGDLIGQAGCALFQKYAPRLKREYDVQAIIVNGENSVTNGRGITSKIVASLRHCGADMVTGGNHIFQQKDILPYLNEHDDLLRPLNFPSACPGRGIGFIKFEGFKIGVISLQGRVFMSQHLDCPFRALESALAYVRAQTPLVIVDFHAEASAEKMGLGHYFDGQVSAILGTHTHTQTADARVLPRGTAFITDLGMSGALNSMIGMKKEPILHNLLTQMPVKFEVDLTGPFVSSGVLLELDMETGLAISIEPFRIIDSEITFSEKEQPEMQSTPLQQTKRRSSKNMGAERSWGE